jgi:uncharacterized protein (UPF0335 family)
MEKPGDTTIPKKERKYVPRKPVFSDEQLETSVCKIKQAQDDIRHTINKLEKEKNEENLINILLEIEKLKKEYEKNQHKIKNVRSIIYFRKKKINQKNNNTFLSAISISS